MERKSGTLVPGAQSSISLHVVLHSVCREIVFLTPVSQSGATKTDLMATVQEHSMAFSYLPDKYADVLHRHEIRRTIKWPVAEHFFESLGYELGMKCVS